MSSDQLNVASFAHGITTAVEGPGSILDGSMGATPGVGSGTFSHDQLPAFPASESIAPVHVAVGTFAPRAATVSPVAETWSSKSSDIAPFAFSTNVRPEYSVPSGQSTILSLAAIVRTPTSIVTVAPAANFTPSPDAFVSDHVDVFPDRSIVDPFIIVQG